MSDQFGGDNVEGDKLNAGRDINNIYNYGDPNAGPAPPPGACPFIAGPMIRDPAYFVGRTDLLRTMAGSLTAPQPNSLNLIGDRRIGKSSLLFHFVQTWPQRIGERSTRTAVGYVDLQSSKVDSETGLYRNMVAELRGYTRLAAPLLAEQTISRQRFNRFLADLHRAGLLPVFCLDEFEMLFKYADRFGDFFYDNWRAEVQAGRLVLLMSSKEPLSTYRDREGLTSDFFNVVTVERVDELTEAEAQALVSLPASKDSHRTAVLSTDEQQTAREWAGTHPFHLQHACRALWDARQGGHDKAWARTRFETRLDGRARPLKWWPRLQLWWQRRNR